MTEKAERCLALAAVCLAALILFAAFAAFAQHKPEHQMLHEKFYSEWMMPDNRNVSCCHDRDCEPAEAYQKDGVWYARKVSEIAQYPEYTRIPAQKVEHDKDTPDGQSHMCGRRNFWNGGEMSVFCFVPGAGG